jgi:hypothetical protein
MKKIFLFLLLTTTLTVKALSPNEMLIMIGAVKYYNENCAARFVSLSLCAFTAKFLCSLIA